MPDVSRAFRSVEDTITRSESRSTRAAQQGASQRQRVVDIEARDKARAIQKQDAEVTRLRRSSTREAEQAAKAESRAVERAAREKIQSMLRADRSIAQARAQGGREAERIIRNEAKAAKQAADSEVRDAKRVADAKAKASASSSAYMSRVRERSLNMADRYQDSQTRQRARESTEAGERRYGYARAAGQGLSQGLGVVRRGASHLASTVAQLGGGFTVADALQQSAALEKESVGFVNASPDKTGLNAKDIQAQARAVSAKTGIDASEVLAGGRAFLSKTGNATEALSNMQTFGELATGTGAKVDDVANAAGILRVQNKNLTPEQMKSTLLQVVRQGQKGAIEFSDLAGSIGKITKSSASYAGDQTTNQGKLLGLAQVAMATSGSPQEASTVVSNIASDAMKYGDKMTKALGAGTFNSHGQIAKGPEEFIADVMGKTGGNLQKIQALGFGARSMKMFQALAPEFNEAEAKKTGSGRDAVLGKIKDQTAEPMSVAELTKSVTASMATSSMQFEAAVRELKATVGDKLIPELVKLVPVIQQLVPTLTRFLDEMIGVANWAASHPFAALTGLLTTSVLKAVVEAKIGEVIKSVITGSGGSGGVPGVAGGAGGGGMSLAAGGLVTAGAALQVAYLDQQVTRVTDAQGQGDARAKLLTDMANNGKAGEAAAGLQDAKEQSGVGNWAQTAITAAARGAKYLNPAAMIGQYASDAAVQSATGKGPSDVEQMQKTIAASQVTSNKELIAALDRNTAASKGAPGAGLNNPTQPISNRQPAAK